MADPRYVYNGPSFDDIDINPEIYRKVFFQWQIDMESVLFYELRKKNNILPYKLSESSKEELAGISNFFDQHAESFFFLRNQKDIIGSILVLEDYIQSLVVNPAYQRQGWGSLLTKYAINYTYTKGFRSVYLEIMPGNTEAEKLYAKIGFVRTG